VLVFREFVFILLAFFSHSAGQLRKIAVQNDLTPLGSPFSFTTDRRDGTVILSSHSSLPTGRY
jgi:hypothetical protein